MLLKKLDPQTGEEEAVIRLKGFSANTVEVTFGAGSLWVSSGDWTAAFDVVLRVDPETNRVVDRIPVDSPTGLAFGHGSVWATSAGDGTVSRIDPETGEVSSEIDVGRGVVDIATDERSGDVWIAGLYMPEDYSEGFSRQDSEYNKISRVDPQTNHVVAEIPIVASSLEGGAQSVAVGAGAVWAQSGDGKLFKVNPATNEVVGGVPLGEYSSDLAVWGAPCGPRSKLLPERGSCGWSPARCTSSPRSTGPSRPMAATVRWPRAGDDFWLTSRGGLARVAP